MTDYKDSVIHGFNPGDCILGIDPGVNGGISVWRYKHGKANLSMYLNYTLYHLSATLKDIKSLNKMHNNQIYAWIERIWGQPNNSAVSNGKKMDSFGEIKGVLIGADVPGDHIELVNPMTWKSYAYKGISRKDKDTKAIAKEAAIKLMGWGFVSQVPPELIDCLLIGKYAVNQYEYKLRLVQ